MTSGRRCTHQDPLIPKASLFLPQAVQTYLFLLRHHCPAVRRVKCSKGNPPLDRGSKTCTTEIYKDFTKTEFQTLAGRSTLIQKTEKSCMVHLWTINKNRMLKRIRELQSSGIMKQILDSEQNHIRIIAMNQRSQKHSEKTMTITT